MKINTSPNSELILNIKFLGNRVLTADNGVNRIY